MLLCNRKMSYAKFFLFKSVAKITIYNLLRDVIKVNTQYGTSDDGKASI